MSGFSDRKIVIPEAILNRDWDAAFADRSDDERRLITFQKRMSELLRDISGQTATPERTAWMIFWVRSFTASLDTLAALQASSEQMLTILQRMCFEMELQFQLIKEIPDEVLDRFRAYTAWCLWSDINLLKEMKHPNAMEAACDTKTAQKIISDPVERQFVEEFFGGGDEFYRVAQNFNRVEAERGLNVELRRLRELLNDRSLSVWRHRLEAQQPPSSFFAMCNENTPTLPRLLRQMEMRFAYSLYSRGSMAIHGTSLDQFIYETGERSWVPRIAPVGKRWRNTATAIASHLDETYLFLLGTKMHVWESSAL